MMELVNQDAEESVSIRFLNQESDISWEFRKKCRDKVENDNRSLKKKILRIKIQNVNENMIKSGEKYEFEQRRFAELRNPLSSTNKEEYKIKQTIRERVRRIRSSRNAALSKKKIECDDASISFSTINTRPVAPYHMYNLYPTRLPPSSKSILTADSKHFDPERRMSL